MVGWGIARACRTCWSRGEAAAAEAKRWKPGNSDWRGREVVKSGGKQTLLTEDDVLRLLRAEIAKAGSQLAWASQMGVERTIVNGMLHGKRRPQPKVLRALGLKIVVAYARL
jgi:hypothetical protein